MTEVKCISKANLMVRWKVVSADELIQMAKLISQGIITKENLMSGNGHKKEVLPPVESQEEAKGPVVGACPECGANLIREGGCCACYNCGYSMCS